MTRRFFIQQKVFDGTVLIDGDQAHHAMHVMRFSVGEAVTLFDGTGYEYGATIATMGKKNLQLAITSTVLTPPLDVPNVTIAAAIPKGDRQKFLVEKLVELGVARLIPLKTSRSVSVANPNVIERFQKGVIEASKQCGRNYLMQVTPQHSIAELLALATNETDTACFLADPDATADLISVSPQSARKRTIAIGPEGGFDPSEIALFESANWNPVRLGPTILRIETAAVMSAVLLAMQDQH